MILLINPDAPPDSPWGFSRKLPPLGLAYIASTLEAGGFRVQIHDNYLLRNSINEIKALVGKADPEFVGVSCNSINYSRAMEISKAVKEVKPECHVIVGGPHATCLPESILEHEEVDYVIVGEGEQAMLELIRNYRGGDSTEMRIPGLAYRTAEGIHVNQSRFIEDLDQVPLPARHLLNMDKYDRKVEYIDAEPVDILNVVRGCPFKCRFCETKKIWGDRSRYFSPMRVADEVEHLVERYGARGVYFIGDNFTINRAKAMEICRGLIERGLDVKWACDTRVDLVDAELLSEMKKAGCETIWFGVESGSQRVLKILNKGITVDQAVKAFKLCREVGIKTACSFLMGVPGETLADMKLSFRLAKKLKPDWCQFNVYVAVPGSELYDEVVREKLYSHIDGFAAYVKTEDFDYKRVIELQRIFHKKMSRTPKRMLKGLVKKFKLILMSD